MRQSVLFTKTRRDAPKDEVSKNADLLIRAGFISKEMAGIYDFLPLGLLVIKNIENIIRNVMNKLGGQEILMSALQDSSLWKQTDRWDERQVDNWFKTKLKNGGDLGLGFTHEEPITRVMKDHIRSFRDLPVFPYQFQTKFRNEMRAKSGILRGREFIMKDMYSFCKSENEQRDFYEKVKFAYFDIFREVGLQDVIFTYASGGSFSKYSHEFQVRSEAGEDEIHICIKCSVAINDEIFSEQKKCPKCGGDKFKMEKAVEVGNIFNLGQKFSEALGLSFSDEKGLPQFPYMGSYGIGIGRLMGILVEILSDDKGIVWPHRISPFHAHLIHIGGGESKKSAEDLYESLTKNNFNILFDDRDKRAGEKFNDADLIGISKRLVLSDKTLAEKKVEFSKRNDLSSVSFESIENVVNILKKDAS